MEDYREQFEKVFERLSMEDFLKDPSSIIPIMLESGFDPRVVQVLDDAISEDAELFEDAVTQSDNSIDGIVSELAERRDVSVETISPLILGIRSSIQVPGTEILDSRWYGVCRASSDALYSLDMRTLLNVSRDIKHFTVPSTVTRIGDRAFADRESLKDIEIPDSVMSIGYSAFSDCKSLKKIRIPDSVTTIGDYAFSDCKSLKKVRLPRSLEAIGMDAFAFCESLEKVDIPDSVTDIGIQAFGWCYSLKRVRIPASVTAIGRRAFLGCDLVRFEVDPDNRSYSSRKGALFDREGKVLLAGYPLVHDGACDIPDDVKAIGDHALSCCHTVKKMRISDSVVSIGTRAFSGCINMRSIRIPDTIPEIGEEALFYCRSLKEIRIPNSVKTIGMRAFSGCESLKEIHIPPSVEEIGSGAFSWCKSLEYVELPDSLSRLEGCVFDGCKALKKIRIPPSVEEIGDHAFSECRSLNEVRLPDSVKSIGYRTFAECDSLKRVSIPSSVEIGPTAFAECDSLRKVRIPVSVENIGGLAFLWCFSARFDVDPDNRRYSSRNGALFDKDGSVLISGYRLVRKGVCVIPDGVKVIDDYALSWCELLKEVRIPSSVVEIGEFSFEGCESARYIVDPDNGCYKSVDGKLMRKDGAPYFQECQECVVLSIECSRRFDPRFSRGYRSAIRRRT